MIFGTLGEVKPNGPPNGLLYGNDVRRPCAKKPAKMGIPNSHSKTHPCVGFCLSPAKAALVRVGKKIDARTKRQRSTTQSTLLPAPISQALSAPLARASGNPSWNGPPRPQRAKSTQSPKLAFEIDHKRPPSTKQKNHGHPSNGAPYPRT